MSSQWFYKHNGEKFGPVTTKQLRSLAVMNQLLPVDLIWRDGMAEWVNAEGLTGLFQVEVTDEPQKAASLAPVAAEGQQSSATELTHTVVEPKHGGRKAVYAFDVPSKLAMLGSGLRVIAQLTVKNVERASFNLYTLPKVYRKLGHQIEITGDFKAEYLSVFQTHEKLKDKLTTLGQNSSSWPLATSLTAKAKTSLVRITELVKKLIIQRRMNKTLENLGELAFEKRGEHSGTAHVVGPIVRATARIASLKAEITALSATNRIQLSLLRRTVLGAFILLVSIRIFIWSISSHLPRHEIPGSRTRAAVSNLPLTSVPRSFGSFLALGKDWSTFDKAVSSDDQLSALAQVITDANRDPDRQAGQQNAAAAHSVRSQLLCVSDKESALTEAQEAIRLGPNEVMCCLAYITRGVLSLVADQPNVSMYCYQPTQRTRDVISDFRKVISIHPPNKSWVAFAHLVLFKEEFMASDDTAADHDLSQAVALDPQSESVIAFQRAMPTLVFWRNTWRVVAHAAAEMKPVGFQQSLQILRSEADSIASFNTAGVDQDAVQCALSYKNWLREVVYFSEANVDGEKLIEALLRGAAGDPFGTAVEEIKSAEELNGKLQEFQRQLEDTRSILSSRYNVEF